MEGWMGSIEYGWGCQERFRESLFLKESCKIIQRSGFYYSTGVWKSVQYLRLNYGEFLTD